IRAGVSGILIYLLFLQIGKENLGKLPEYAREANFLWLAVATALFFLALIWGTIRWGWLLKAQNIHLSFSDLFTLTYVGFFFSNFLPGVVGGDLVKFYYLGKKTGKMSSSFTSVFMDRVIGFMGLLSIAFVALLLNLERTAAREFFPLIVGATSLLLIIFFLLLNHRFYKLLSFLNHIKWLRLGERIQNLFQSFKTYRKSPHALLKAYLISLLVQFQMIIIVYFISLAFHLPIPAVYFFLFFPLVAVIMSIPISISGLGTREWAFVFFFSSLPAVSEVDALALSLALYLITLFTSLWGGVIYMWKGGEIRKCYTNTSE
ncbi:MAG: flippase-like domain-containing protein, partial [Caldiserica bacterium]|nr:flippase-like domain-containing protein [Caldisericota bacterium]